MRKQRLVLTAALAVAVLAAAGCGDPDARSAELAQPREDPTETTASSGSLGEDKGPAAPDHADAFARAVSSLPLVAAGDRWLEPASEWVRLAKEQGVPEAVAAVTLGGATVTEETTELAHGVSSTVLFLEVALTIDASVGRKPIGDREQLTLRIPVGQVLGDGAAVRQEADELKSDVPSGSVGLVAVFSEPDGSRIPALGATFLRGSSGIALPLVPGIEASEQFDDVVARIG